MRRALSLPALPAAALVAAVLLPALLLPGAAQAHNFKTGTAITQAMDAVGAALNDPVLLLTLIPLGVLASIWQIEGLLKLWGWAAVGLLAGVPLAAVATPWFIVLSLALGVVCAVLGVIARDYPTRTLQALAVVVGLVAMMTLLEGHGFLELSVAIYAGLLLASVAVIGIAAAVTRLVVEKLPGAVARIAGRILASWAAAIALMLLAFEVQKLVVA